MAELVKSVAGAIGGIIPKIGSLFGRSKRKQKEAEARAKEEKAKSDAKIAEQERLKLEYERKSREDLKKLEIEEMKQQAEIKAKNDKEKREHEQRLRELENARFEKNQQLKIHQKEEAIKQCQNDIIKFDESIAKAEKSLSSIIEDKFGVGEDLNTLSSEIESFSHYKSLTLEKFDMEIGLSECLEKLQISQNEIKAAIDKTNVHEDNIQTFFLLIENLMDATVVNQEKSNYLSASMETFGDMVGRATNSELSIEQYWGHTNMSPFIEYLKKEEYENMSDLVCDDDGEFDEIQEIISKGMEEEHKLWENEKKTFENDPSNKDIDFEQEGRKEPPTTLKKVQSKKLKKVCMNPSTWEEERNDKIEQSKELLNEICNPLSSFFNKMGTAVKQAQQLLTYNNNDHLTQDQQRAIVMASNISNQDISIANKYNNFKAVHGKSKSLQSPSNNNSNTPMESKLDLEDEENTNQMHIPGQVNNPIESKDEEKNDFEFNNSSNMADQSEEFEDLKEELSLAKAFDRAGKEAFEQCLALNKVAISNINVVCTMYNEFDGSPNLTQALGIAEGVEGTCMELIRSIGSIRQSIVLAHCLIKMKPANLSTEARKLWDAVDGGIVQIFNNAMKMSKVSAKYFGFFLKFRQSFQSYLAGKDRSLVVSTGDLRKDVKDFQKMSIDFNKQVSVLGDSAMKIIEDCVKNTAGATNFEKHRRDRQKKLDLYLKRKKLYDEKEMKLDNEYGILLEKRGKLKAKEKQLEFVMNGLKTQIEFDRKMVESTQNTLNSLRGKDAVGDYVRNE